MPKTSEEYTKLYHYTTWKGLLGILRTQSLWATHYKFLNDYSEIIFFKEKLVSLIQPHVRNVYEKVIKYKPEIEKKINEKGGVGYVVQHDTEVVVDAQYRATGDEIYILSFCGEHEDANINNNGLLSQWRGYGAGGGCAIVFDTKKIEDLLELEAKSFEYSTGHISDVIYSDNDQKFKEELSDHLEIIAEDVTKIFDHRNINKQPERPQLKSYTNFVNCITRYKHYGFKEENEVRVVALPTVINKQYLNFAKANGITPKPEKERKFRKINAIHIPYIDLFSSIEIDLPIEKIIIGPHREKESRASALRVMLRQKDIDVTCSEIPFVG